MSNIVTMENQTLGLQGIPNARQLGGYSAADGRKVRRDILLRTGALGKGMPEDLQTLTEKYSVTTIVDLRTTPEIAEAPDPALPGAENIVLHVLDENAASSSSAAMLQVYVGVKDDPGRALLELYRMGALVDDMYTSFLDSEVSMTGYRRFFDLLLAHEEGAFLWHCTGGKDRTGISSVLLLAALGVDRETALADFALTNDFNHRRIDYILNEARKHTSDPAELAGVADLVGVSRANMERLFDLAEAECGSMLAFIQKRFALSDDEVARLRDKYLE